MKTYWYDTQKGKVIRIIILKWADKWYEDFQLEHFIWIIRKWIFVWNNAWARLSQLKKDWVVEVKYFENPNAIFKWVWKRAKYRLKNEYILFYKKLYNLW